MGLVLCYLSTMDMCVHGSIDISCTCMLLPLKHDLHSAGMTAASS